MSDNYDVIVIGAVRRAIRRRFAPVRTSSRWRASMSGRTPTARYAFGGTCLNAGCIPSKALLESSELYHRAKHEFALHGIKIGDVKLDLAQMQKRARGIVKTMTNGIAALFKAAGVGGHPGPRPAAAGQQRAGDGTRRLAEEPCRRSTSCWPRARRPSV